MITVNNTFNGGLLFTDDDINSKNATGERQMISPVTSMSRWYSVN